MRTLIAVALLLAVVAIGLAAIPYAVAWERYRPDIEAAFEKMTGHDVTIAGPIDIVLLPRPSLTAQDVTMTGRTNESLGFQLRSQQVDVGFQAGPFLVGRPLADWLKLTRPILVLDQEVADAIMSWPPALDAWSGLFFPQDLRLMSIDGGRLQLGEQQTSATDAVSDLTMTLARTEEQGPFEAAGLFKTRHHRFTIAAEIGRASKDGGRTIEVELGALNGVDETTTLELNGVLGRQGPDAGFKGRIDLAGPDLKSAMKSVAALAGSPTSLLSLAAGQPFRVETRFQATRNAITTEDAKITMNDKLGRGRLALQLSPKPKLDLDLDLPIVQLADETTLIDFVPLDLLSLFPTMPGRIDVNLRETMYRSEAIKRSSIAIVTESGGLSRIERAKAFLPGLMDVQFEGRIRQAENGRVLSGRLTSAGDNLGETMGWLGLPLTAQDETLRGFSLESDVTISSVEVALSAIDMRLDTSKVGGKAALRFSERLVLGLDVDVERLNLDLYDSGDGSVIEFARFLNQQFKQLNASVDARFERLSWRGLRFEKAALSADIEDQHFRLGSMVLQTVGSTETIVEGEIDLQTEAVDLTMELKSEFPSRALRHADLRLPLASARLMPIALSGWVTGRLGGFDIGLRADYDGGQGLIEGQAGWVDDRAHYDLTINAEHPDHQALAGHFGLAPLIPADDAPGPFMIDGQLRHEQDGDWVTAGSVKLGPTSMTGRLLHQQATEKGNWEARVSIGHPKWDSLAPFLALGGYRSTGQWTPGAIMGRLPHLSLRTAWLDELDGSLSLSARGGLASGGINLSAKLDDGFLYVDEVEADLWNGALTGEMSLERRRDQPFASIAVELDDIDAEALTDWLDIPKTIEGPLSLKLEASSAGRTIFDFVRGLSGDIEIDMAKGQLHGTGIPSLRKTLSDRMEEPAEPTPTPSSPQDPLIMPLSSFNAASTLKRGVMTLDEGAFAFDPGLGVGAEATMEGTLDLLLWIAELTLDITAEDSEMSPLALRIVGSPKGPQGLLTAP